MDKAAEMGFPALAITDHGVLYGAIDFYQAAKAKGIKPIIGCEVYVAPGSRLEKKTSAGGRDVYNHLVLLAKDEVGYKNLIKLVTVAHLEGYYYKPRIDKELLAAHSQGLIATSGCLKSEIPEWIRKGDVGRARAAVDWFKQVFGPDNFYLELQNHGIAEQAKVNSHLVPWAKEFGLKLIATNDVHYVEKDHWRAHDCLICIGTQSLVSDTNRMRYQPEQFFLRDAKQMRELFPEAPEAVSNTLEVAEKCNLQIKFGELHYPLFEPPEVYTREGYLRMQLAEALNTRYGLRARAEGPEFIIEGIKDARLLPTFKAPEGATGPFNDILDPNVAAAIKVVIDRLQLELKTIEKTGFISYFLIVGDFVRYGRSKGISCVARGSAAGSIVTYLMEISNVDPIRYNLLFERFLNPERVNPPDIDIDFADDRRADVIEYVRQKYGRDSVAQIITFGTMGAKSVVRDVGRVQGLGFADTDRLAKMVPAELKMSLAKALKDSADLKQAYETEESTRELLEIAFVLEDLTRNSSVHAAGVVIGPEPLVNLLPLKQDEDGTIVTQYAMGPVGDLGLLKMDFLGLKTLTVIRNSCEMVKQTRGVEVPIDNLPLDDAKTYDLLNKGLTVGVFQLESGGMRDLCRKFQIGSVEHITALIALYRPGPMDLIPEFIKRRHGEVKIEYEHPLLESISSETYGILVYQEQVMQAAQVLAGYTLGGADLLRRAMGKKKVEEMQKQRETFVKGAAERNKIPAAQANQIFDLLEKFAGYGFNKSHAAAYAIVSYQTAYLKANYPVEFLSAMLTNDMNDTAKLSILINEARAFDIQVLAPDINESQVVFAPAQNGTVIRFGLAAVKGLGEIAVQSILDARQTGGKFKTLADLCDRVDTRTVNRKVLEALIRSGACDCFGETRATLENAIDSTLARAAAVAQDRARGQSSFFDMLQEKHAPKEEPLVRLPEWPAAQKLAYEKELLGFYVSGHPLNPYLSLVQKFALANTDNLANLQNRAVTRIAGLVSAVQQGISKKSNKPYAMVTLEDLEGTVQILFMNENYDKFMPVVQAGEPLLVTGEVNLSEDKPKIFPQEVMKLTDAPKKLTKMVQLRFNAQELTPEKLDSAHQLAVAHPGKIPLFLCVKYPGGEMVFIEAHERFYVSPSHEFQLAIQQAFGADAYYAKADLTLPERTPRKWEKRNSAGDDE